MAIPVTDHITALGGGFFDTDPNLQYYIDRSTEINGTNWGEFRNEAIALMVCHWLTMFYNSQNGIAPGSVTGAIKRRRDLDSEIEYHQSPNISGIDDLHTTMYGQRYQYLVGQVFTGIGINFT